MGLEPSMGLEFQGLDSASGFRFSSQGFGMGLPGLEICGTIDFCERGGDWEFLTYPPFGCSSQLCKVLLELTALRLFVSASSPEDLSGGLLSEDRVVQCSKLLR